MEEFFTNGSLYKGENMDEKLHANTVLLKVLGKVIKYSSKCSMGLELGEKK